VKDAFKLGDNADSLWDQFRINSIDYGACGMLVFALLVNREISKAKSEIMWDLFDITSEGILDKNDIEQLLTMSIDASLKVLLQPSISLTEYHRNLSRRATTMRQHLLIDMFGNRSKLPRVEFINKLVRDKNYSILLDTSLIRKRLEETAAVKTEPNAEKSTLQSNELTE
jgi:hypothetical protein